MDLGGLGLKLGVGGLQVGDATLGVGVPYA
jgi:hypothetical protein